LIGALAATKSSEVLPLRQAEGQDSAAGSNACQPPQSLERSGGIIHPKFSSEPGLRGELPATSAEMALVDKCCRAVWSEATE